MNVDLFHASTPRQLQPTPRRRRTRVHRVHGGDHSHRRLLVPLRPVKSSRSCSSRSCSPSACRALGSHGEPVLQLSTRRSHLFPHGRLIMKQAPIGAFGAMAFTIGKYGVGPCCRSATSCWPSTRPACCSSLASWAAIAALCGFSFFKFIRYMKEESDRPRHLVSKSVLPRMIAKMENLGCEAQSLGWWSPPDTPSISMERASI